MWRGGRGELRGGRSAEGATGVENVKGVGADEPSPAMHDGTAPPGLPNRRRPQNTVQHHMCGRATSPLAAICLYVDKLTAHGDSNHQELVLGVATQL